MLVELTCIGNLNCFCFVSILNVKIQGEFNLCSPLYCKFVLRRAVQMHSEVG